MRQGARAGDTQSIEGSATERNGMSRPSLIEAQGFCYACRNGIGPLRGVVKSFASHRRDITQAALHLIRDRQGGEEIVAAAANVLSRGENGP